MNNFAIENYRPSRPLGQGAYGTVLLYELQLPNDTLPAKVAVKVFQSREVASREWANMERLVASSPPNIVKCYGLCQLEDGQQGLVMETFDSDIQQFITEPCALPKAKEILRQIARGLKHLHQENLVHRDVKPDNVLVRVTERGRIQVSLTDLGVSKLMTSTQRSNQTNTGTDLWKAPEVLGERPTYGHPADVFGFGLIALFILTTEFPLGGGIQGTDNKVFSIEHITVHFAYKAHRYKATPVTWPILRLSQPRTCLVIMLPAYMANCHWTKPLAL